MGDVTFTGNFQDLGENAALVLATYKFTPATGPVDQGNVDLIRNFPPHDNDIPPIGGRWRGTSRSDLGQGQSTLELLITQDGTGFGGQEVVDAGTPQELRFDFVGTLDERGTFVVIGAGAAGRFFVGGALNPPPRYRRPGALSAPVRGRQPGPRHVPDTAAPRSGLIGGGSAPAPGPMELTVTPPDRHNLT